MKKIVNLYIYVIISMLLFGGIVVAGEKVFFYHTDPAGTPLAMTDSSGNVVWRADYKPFGEEQSVTQNLENVKKFVGKEKDKETGMYYFGARYMKAEMGRFISPDPVGPVDPRTSKTNYGMLLNPQKMNRYAYSLNNPHKYLDINGKWEEDVHSGINKGTYGTYTWARQAGFSSKEARAIANGNNRTDGGPFTSFLPFYSGGDQSRHFNNPFSFGSILGDTRDFWAKTEFQLAILYMEDGNIEAALGHFGKGLHSLQDKYAHRNWDTGALEKDAHPGWYDDWNDPRNKGAADNTRRTSMEYLKSFKERFKPEGTW